MQASCTITPSSLDISRYNGEEVIQCRLRYISFFALGVDPRFIGIVSILGPIAMCYVLKIKPNACRMTSILQENIIVSFTCLHSDDKKFKLRYQKAIEAKKIIDKNATREGRSYLFTKDFHAFLLDSAMLSKIVDLTPERKSLDIPPLSDEKPVSRWRSLLSLIKKT